jgi:hypothetical protein
LKSFEINFEETPKERNEKRFTFVRQEPHRRQQKIYALGKSYTFGEI